ncbi:MAG: DNA polymerase IV [Dehalococcoidales bacterium]
MTDRRIMHIDLDAFFVSVEQVLDPELRGKPVVVGGRPDHRGVVAAASYEARAFGLHSGMPLATAVRLCPQAIFIEGSFPRYRAASAAFMAILGDFSPFLEPLGLDEAYLDATGFESLHGSIRRMALAIKQRIRDEQGLVASIGIADAKVVAKIASDLSKPDGLIEVPPGEEASFLAPLPIDKMPGIGKKTERRLRGLGIKTLDQLAEVPAKVLRSHFGASGEALQRHARGTDNRKVSPPGVAKSISRETTFDSDVGDGKTLEATLRYLSERVAGDLRRRSRQARCITLKLRYADFTTLTRSQTLAQAIDADQVVFGTGVKLLRQALSGQRQPVRLIGIGVSNLSEPGRQLAMLDASGARIEKLNRTVDRIREKYGFTSIQTGRTLRLRDIFRSEGGDYTLPTPSLSR